MRIGVNCFILSENMGGLRQYFHRLFRELLASDQKNSYVFFYFEHNIKEMEHIGDERWKKDAILLKDQQDVLNHLDLIDHLQPRVAVLSEEHTIKKTGSTSEILGDEELLIGVNLIHEHVHKHGDEEHRHFHSHYRFHKH